MNGGTPFFVPGNTLAGMTMQQQPQGGYVARGGAPAVPARAGGIPVLSTAMARTECAPERAPTAVVRGVRGAEPAARPPPRATFVAIPTPEAIGVR